MLSPWNAFEQQVQWAFLLRLSTLNPAITGADNANSMADGRAQPDCDAHGCAHRKPDCNAHGCAHRKPDCDAHGCAHAKPDAHTVCIRGDRWAVRRA